MEQTMAGPGTGAIGKGERSGAAERRARLREKLLELGPRALTDEELESYFKALAARRAYPPEAADYERRGQSLLDGGRERARAILCGHAELDDRLATAVSHELTARIFDRLLREGAVRRDAEEAGTFEVAPAAPEGVDLADVRGQEAAKRGLEVAAAGGHRVLLVGPTGSSKTLLARRVPGLLPLLREEERHEVEALYRRSGRVVASGERPFVEVTPSVTPRELLGGGARPRPGLVSLAHPGTLVLDGLERFPRRLLDALREPLEHGSVSFVRPDGTRRFPARFVFMATMRSCPCGYRGYEERECRCSPRALEEHWKRIPTWLRESFDLVLDLFPVGEAELCSGPGERSAEYAYRVAGAWERQEARAGGAGTEALNAYVPLDIGELQRQLDTSARRLLEEVRLRYPAGLPFLAGARGEERALRVARTSADLQGSERVGAPHLAEALQYAPAPWHRTSSGKPAKVAVARPRDAAGGVRASHRGPRGHSRTSLPAPQSNGTKPR